MSRIHEALKQAAHGREPALFPGEAKPNHSVVAEAGHGNRHEWLNRRVPTSEERAAAVSDFLGLNDLWQRCRKPGWTLDPTYSAFSNSKSFTSCAEQFSKLRTRLYEFRDNEPLHTLLVTRRGEKLCIVEPRLSDDAAAQSIRVVGGWRPARAEARHMPGGSGSAGTDGVPPRGGRCIINYPNGHRG